MGSGARNGCDGGELVIVSVRGVMDFSCFFKCGDLQFIEENKLGSVGIRGDKKMQRKKSLGKWIIEKYNTNQWRESKLSEVKKTKEIQKLLDILGREELIKQARELASEGYIEIIWGQVNTDIKALEVYTNRLDDLCRRENVVNPRDKFAQKKQLIQGFLEKIREEEGSEWLVGFYQDLLEQIGRASKELPKNARDDKLLICLNEIALLKEDIWNRQFSNQVFGDSKEFKKHYQGKVLQILSTYSERATEEMEPEEILTEFKILSFSQVLECKGNLQYELATDDNKYKIDTCLSYYGHILNAQTLTHSHVVNAEEIKQVMTIENKANYENMVYDSHCLYIYTHGFFSFKERAFLATLNEALPEDVEFLHWSDMDYGGIRIFRFVKEKVFKGRDVKPWKMGKMEYLQSLEEGRGREIDNGLREKLEKIKVPELEELRQCILEYGEVFEQEQLMGKE